MHFAGLDVSVETTAISVIDDKGVQRLSAEVPTDPGAIEQALKPFRDRLKRVGHEAGALAPWLEPELLRRGLPVVCLEARHVRAALNAQRNKTDATDALGIAHILRTGWFKRAHIKSEQNYRLRLVLIQRRNLKRKFIDIENTIRHSLKAFGIRLGRISRGKFDAKVRELVADHPLTKRLMESMLHVRTVMWEEYCSLHKLVLALVQQNETCRRFMEIPGIGPVAALAFFTGLDDPTRFHRSRDVGAYFGLTSRRWQSGTSIDVQGHISKRGDADVRRSLYEAAHIMLTRYKGDSQLKRWGEKLAKTKGLKKATVAVARKLAVIMFVIWRDGTFYETGVAENAEAKAKRTTGKAYKNFVGLEASDMDPAMA